MTYLYLALAIAAEVLATTMMKSTEGFSKPLPSLITILGYGVSLYFLSLCLKTLPVGVAYAIWSGVGIVAISLLAYGLYGQKLDTPALIGMGLIIAGVLVINLFSKTTGH